MINNYSLIKKLLIFDTEGDNYYFIQILQRAKDDKSIGSNNRLIKTYAIKSLSHFEKVYPEIVTICEAFKARAYIHLTKRSFKRVSLLMMKELCDRITNNQCLEIPKLFNTASGTFTGGKDKLWVVDIDTKDMVKIVEVSDYIEDSCEPIGNKIIAIIPTLNGFHLITKPFNVDKFNMKYCDIEIHKNNPTILFIPDMNRINESIPLQHHQV